MSGYNIRFDSRDVVGKVDECSNVNSELSKNGTNDVNVEDIRLRSLLGQTFDGLDANELIPGFSLTMSS